MDTPNHQVGDLILYVRTTMDLVTTYDLGMVSKIVKDIGDGKIKYLIEWADDSKNVGIVQKRYSDHTIQTYKEWLEIHIVGRKPDKVLEI
jgi:hypothetical protein